MDKIKSLFKYFKYYLLGNKIVCTDISAVEITDAKISSSVIRLRNKSKLIIGKNVKLHNVHFEIDDGSIIKIDDGCNICDAVIDCKNSKCHFGEENIISKGYMYCNVPILLRDSEVDIGNHNRFRCGKFWVRFGGKLIIGNYNNLNEHSEVRCDESIIIGDFNQVSYSVKIWDTNTHCIYAPETRRKITKDNFPVFGKENERPKTKPVTIGSDNWLGMNVMLLKGCHIGDKTNIGIGTIVSNKTLPSESTIVMETKLKILNSKIQK